MQDKPVIWSDNFVDKKHEKKYNKYPVVYGRL